jgi:hypothetical protein
MKDIFSDLQKEIENSNDRWAEIEKLKSRIKDAMDENGKQDLEGHLINNTELIVQKNAELLLLLVDHFRPLGSMGSQATNIQKEIESIANMFSPKKGKR